MQGEKDLDILLKSVEPTLNTGRYVFCITTNVSQINLTEIILCFRESEGYTIILEKQVADRLRFNYDFIASWITLSVYSALDAVGLTAAFSKALTEEGISCNVVAGYFHDHIFVAEGDAERAMITLKKLSE